MRILSNESPFSGSRVALLTSRATSVHPRRARSCRRRACRPLVDLDPRLELRPPPPCAANSPVAVYASGPPVRIAVPLPMGSPRRAPLHRRAPGPTWASKGSPQTRPSRNQEVRAERPIVEAIETAPSPWSQSHRASVRRMRRSNSALPSMSGAYSWKLGSRAHLRNVSARMDLSDPFVLDVPVQSEVAPRVLRLQRVDVEAVIARPDFPLRNAGTWMSS